MFIFTLINHGRAKSVSYQQLHNFMKEKDEKDLDSETSE